MQTDTAPDGSARATAYELWRMRLYHYLQLARSGASSARLAPAASAVHAAARDAQLLTEAPSAISGEPQNQE